MIGNSIKLHPSICFNFDALNPKCYPGSGTSFTEMVSGETGTVNTANGGSISIGHPFGMTGSRQVGHVARELNRRGGKYGIVTMCVGGGMGATGLFEAYNS